MGREDDDLYAVFLPPERSMSAAAWWEHTSFSGDGIWELGWQTEYRGAMSDPWLPENVVLLPAATLHHATVMFRLVGVDLGVTLRNVTDSQVRLSSGAMTRGRDMRCVCNGPSGTELAKSLTKPPHHPPGSWVSMPRRQALGLLLIFLLLLGGRALRHAWIVGDAGRWREGMWLESLLPVVEEARAEPEPPPPAGPFNVNRAPVDTLVFLPGVGPVLAERIVAEREEGGAFADLQDLQRVKASVRNLLPSCPPM